MIETMEAIILAGGFGTRLRHVVSDIPKPMAPVCDRPFLEYILNYLQQNGIIRVVLATGYKHEAIESHFGASYKNMELIYSVEDTPLFTGGAIKKALKSCNESSVYVINGDTFFDVDLETMYQFHIAQCSDLTIAMKHMERFERYGTLELDGDRITGFREKQKTTGGYINGGIYLMRRDLLEQIAEEKFSFESDFMEKKVNELSFVAFESKGYFIDIGVPEDYAKAQVDFLKFGESV